MKFAKAAFISSWVLIAIGMTVGIVRGKGALGVDFRGGDRLGLRFEKKIEVDRIRDAVAKLRERAATPAEARPPDSWP